MSEETKDQAIKLFGRTIPLTDAHPPSSPCASSAAEPHKAALQEVGEESEEEVAASTSVSGSDAGASAVDATEGVKDASEIEAEMEVQNLNIVADSDKGKESTQFSSSSVSSANEDDHKTCSEYEKATPNAKADLNKVNADGSLQEKLLKKPDKIVPCPRCNSMDTKFCYYNNYNINQPRHFCKNCQRYWTAGGTMRNVPVGAGRRKSKQSSSQYRHIMMPSEGLQSPRLDNPDLAHHQTVPCGPSTSSRPLASNGTVLKFGQVPLRESMASALNIGVQKRNGDFNSVVARENKEEPSCASSITVSNVVTNAVEQIQQNGQQSYCNGVAPLPHFQCYGGTPWPYPWHPGWNNFTALTAARCPSEVVCRPENSTPNPVPWLAPPPFCHPALPFPFMPASFWGWPNGTWNIPWVGSNDGISPTSSTSNNGCFGNNSPTLGKHSRDASLHGENIEKSLWIPKTLRIDDPDEAAKISIWSTLGIKPDEGGIFKSFPSKDVKKAQESDAAQVLHANPAALSRSQSFQEST